MFGAFRFYLAILVAVYHVKTAPFPMMGPLSVFGFYVLSGLLISRVIAERYNHGLRGFAGFFANRATRLYPTYWLLLLISLALYLEFRWAGPPVQFSTNPVDVLANFSMVGLLRRPSFIIPPAWTVSVELVYYTAMAVLLARSRTLITLWWLASLAFSIYLATNLRWRPIYFSYSGATICFSTGAMLYAYQDWFRARAKWLRGWAVPAALFMPFALAAQEAGLLPFAIQRLPLLYVSTAVMVLAIWRLDAARTQGRSAWLVSLNRFLGDLSYPIYLSHFTVIFMVKRVLFPGELTWGETVPVVLAIVLLVSIGIVFGVERPMQNYRGRIRRWSQ